MTKEDIEYYKRILEARIVRVHEQKQDSSTDTLNSIALAVQALVELERYVREYDFEPNEN